MGVPNAEGPWTAARIEKLAKLYNDGMTANEISAALGRVVTRNAVIGKLNRLGFRRSEQQNITNCREHARAKRREERKHQKMQRRIHVVADRDAILIAPCAFPMEEPHGPGLPLLALTSSTCRWPLGEAMEPAKLFCGAPCDTPGSSWCAYHSRRALNI